MGCDIHSHAEVKTHGRWVPVTAKLFPGWDTGTAQPFGNRSYGMFGFLANVRNYSRVPCITGEPRGLPDDYTVGDAYRIDYHSHSWLLLKELLEYNYDQVFEDLRVTREVSPGWFDGAVTADPGEGCATTIREFLGKYFFNHLAILQTLGSPGDVRIVFWFDN